MASITINHVAEKAGVSIKTVSRVLNREPNVAESTRERVNAAVVALKYRPNISARSLAGSRSYLVGLLLDNPRPAYAIALQFGALRRCQEWGYHLLLDSLDSSAPEFQAQMESMLANVRTDGFILSPPLCDNEKILDFLERIGTPYVRIAPYRSINRAPSVNMDEAAAAFEMTTLLLKLGHTQIGFIKGHPDHGATHLRYGGYLSALRAAGVPLVPEWVKQGDFSARTGAECAEELLSEKHRPTAIFASNDEMALGVMMVANRLGLKAPHDLSICGFDDDPAATLVWPQLTTIRQPVAEMSDMAVQMLLSKDTDLVTRLLEFEVVMRGSTGPAPSA